MKILFDQNMPWGLHRPLSDHDVYAAWTLGWAEVRNGELLALAEHAGFDLFVTGDKNIQYQQNLSKRIISIIQLTSTQWPFTQSSLDSLAAAAAKATPGSYEVVECLPLRASRPPSGKQK